MNMSDTTVHFSRLALHKQDMIRWVDYETVPSGSGEHPGCMTETTHIGFLPREENFSMEDGKSRLCSVGKRNEMIANNVPKFARGRDLVLDAGEGTSSTAKASLSFHCHRRSQIFDIDENGVRVVAFSVCQARMQYELVSSSIQGCENCLSSIRGFGRSQQLQSAA